jgi:Peptidase family M28
MRKILLSITLAFVVFGLYQLRPVSYPGQSYQGPLAPLSAAETELKSKLYKHVNAMANKIGERHFLRYKQLNISTTYITALFRHYGYQPTLQGYQFEVQRFNNIIAEVKGTEQADDVVIVGAHYDTVPMSVGADYNATGIAALIELAGYFKQHPQPFTIRFVAFANKEVPFIYGPNMGSVRYVGKLMREHTHVVAMYALEGLGYYKTSRYSQRYPYFLSVFRSDVGDFLAFISNYKNQALLSDSLRAFRTSSPFPSQGFTAPNFISSISSSDHWAFWQKGYPAIMITDTLFYRNKNYLRETDTLNTLDFDRFTRAVIGIQHMLENLRLETPA